MDNIRKALAELVRLHLEHIENGSSDVKEWRTAWSLARSALTEQPIVREPLTDEQIDDILNDFDVDLQAWRPLVRAIEAKHGIGVKGEA